jgi:acyl carrier protein
METILINWLKDYSTISYITIETKFIDLNFDLFDQAMTVDFIKQTFNKNINQREKWYITVGELINDIS